MAALMVFYILLGGVMDELAMMLLTIPVVFPIINTLDFGIPKDEVGIWFGILVLTVVGIGLIAPPIGLGVLIVTSIARDVSIVQVYRRVLPFVAADFIRLSRVDCISGRHVVSRSRLQLGRDDPSRAGTNT